MGPRPILPDSPHGEKKASLLIFSLAILGNIANFSPTPRRAESADADREDTEMLIADYYAGSKTAHATVVFSILVEGRREHVSEILVSGRRDARQQAARRSAKCWNF